MRQNNSVLCAILHVETTTIAWAFGFKNLIVPGAVTGLTGMPFDMGRNSACQQALQNNFSWLFFLDSDVIPPHDAILRLMRHNKPIISGVYHRRSPPVGIPVMQKPAGQWIVNYPPNKVIEVDVVGAGCLLIRRDLLEAVAKQPQRAGKPWFDWRVDMMGHLPKEECMSEDFTFCRHVKRQLGIPILVDTSVQCSHIGNAEARLHSFGPINSIPA